MSTDSAIQALNAIAILLVLVGIGGTIFFRRRATSVSLALGCSVAALPAGFLVLRPSIDHMTIGVAAGASAGLILGAVVGSRLWPTPSASPRLLRGSAVVALIGGIAATRVITTLARIACDHPLTLRERIDAGLGDFCGWNGAVVGFLAVDVALLAVFLTLAANGAQIAAEQ